MLIMLEAALVEEDVGDRSKSVQLAGYAGGTLSEADMFLDGSGLW